MKPLTFYQICHFNQPRPDWGISGYFDKLAIMSESKKTWTNCSSDTLLRFVQVFFDSDVILTKSK